MKKMLLMLVTLTSVSSYAQTGISLGVKAGLNIPQLASFGDNPMSKGYTSRLAGNAALTAEFHFTDAWSLTTALEYTQQGGKRKGMQAIPSAMLERADETGMFKTLLAYLNQDYLYADFKSETQFNYLMIPVHARYSFRFSPVSPLGAYVSMGPFVSFLMSAKQKMKGRSYLYVDPAADMTLDYVVTTLMGSAYAPGERDMSDERSIYDDLNKVNAGLSASVGISYNFTSKYRIYIEGSGNYGFIVMQKNSENGQNRIGAAAVALGCSMKIK